MSWDLAVILIGSLSAAACALVGVFLVLRSMALVSDAITHAILLGIVVVFFIVQDFNSPLLILGAAAAGVLTVWLIELLTRTRLIKEDASIGLVFPLLFAVAVILINLFAGDVHLDTHMVLVGDIGFAAMDNWQVGGTNLGPPSLWMMGAICLINLAFIVLFYKELKLSTFDAGLAAALGFAPGVLHYVLVSLVSVTAVGAFDAVGSILVIALMIAPAAAAYLLTDRLPVMLMLSVAFGVASAVLGFYAALLLNTTIAGAIATLAGVLFTVVLLSAPRRGLTAIWLRQRRQRVEFAAQMLAVHLMHHEHDPDAELECSVTHCTEHLKWSQALTQRVLGYAIDEQWIRHEGELLVLQPEGRQAAREVLSRS